MKPFYSVPFVENTWYVTTCEIKTPLDKIPEGTELQYLSTSFSRYDGMIGFFFKDNQGNDRRWDISDDSDPLKESEGTFRKKNKAPNQRVDLTR